MANWTTPKNNWQVNELVTAAQMNDIGENLLHLKGLPRMYRSVLTPASTTSTALFTMLQSMSVTTSGGGVLVGAILNTSHNFSALGTGVGYFDVSVNAVRVALGGMNGCVKQVVTDYTSVSLSLVVDDLSAGNYNLGIAWRTDGGSLSVLNGLFWAMAF